jgi:hypothetical protein
MTSNYDYAEYRDAFAKLPAAQRKAILAQLEQLVRKLLTTKQGNVITLGRIDRI